MSKQGTSYELVKKMAQFERRILKELAAEARHPIEEYDEARVARLVEQMELSKRFSWPSTLVYNV